MNYERSVGRGDRSGRYGKDHLLQDMDYRDYGLENEDSGYDSRVDSDGRFDHIEQSRRSLQARLAFHHRGGGAGVIGRGGKGLLWHPDLAHPMIQREEDGTPVQEFEQAWTGLQERGRGRGGRGFHASSAPHPGSGDGNWASVHPEEVEFNIDRQREEDRFTRGNRRALPPRIDDLSLDMSLEEMDQRDQDQKPSNIIMLRMLPPDASANEIREQLQEQGIQPREVRLMRNKSSGQSRGFAFVEFNVIQEATRWMETNQGVLMILGQRVSMHYSDPKPRANEDWLCNKCGVQNFKRREKCFKCNVPKSEAELKLSQLHRDLAVGLQKEGFQGLLPLPAPYHTSGLSATPVLAVPQTDVANDTLILRNLGPHTSVEAIISALAPFAYFSPSNVRLIKDKHTHLNRGFAFLQLSTIVEASQLLQILQALKPPLTVEGKAVVIEFAKGCKRDSFMTDGNKVNAATVASTAIAAAQWAVTQNGSAGGQSIDTAVYQQGAAVIYPQEGQRYAGSDGTTLNAQTVTRGAALAAAGTTLNGAYTGAAVAAAVLSEAVKSGSTIMQQPLTHTQTPHITTAAPTTATQVEIVGKPQLASPSQPATPGTEHELQCYPVPDVSTYQYDEGSGYYYDPLTGLYYDATSQYYFNPHTQQYMYWDGEKHTYILAANQSNNDGAPAGDAAAPSDLLSANKDKKDKPKSKTAQQIAKDMERWAKSLNRQKENMKSVTSSPTAGSASLPGYTRGPGHSRLDDLRESASADAGYAVLEKKGALYERPQMFFDQIRQSAEISPPHQQSLIPAYSGETDSEDEGGEKVEKDGRMTDWVKLACLLCRRQFPSKEALIRHQQLSELHKQNLEQRRSQQEVASKQRLVDEPDYPDPKRRRLSNMEGIAGSSLGARMLQGGVKKGLLMRNLQVE
ncbi:RNA-binding protein 10 isoform X3 [Gouania willdenowi]|uniref:RNA-binding protein 10 isoform X3 n=1 Tax=Gouania willdenowi TaxID=441366 RepID=UPI001056D2E6|nr:RNA-binding protein 10-like isoform X3 [Gouania willdenowi]